MRGSFLVIPFLATVPIPLSAQGPPEPRQASALRVAGYALGGAIVGGWGGYVTAQIAWSDWADREGRGAQRLRFSLTGAALGLIAGVAIGRHGPGTAGAGAPTRVAPPESMRPITAQEIHAFWGGTLTQMLRVLRPHWIRERGSNMFRPEPDPVAAQGVRVYLDGVLLGGLRTLDQIPIYTVTAVAFLDAARATLRWGAGHDDGAILLTTSPTP